MKKSLLIIVILIITLLASLTLVFRTNIIVNRATNYSDNSPVLSNSYLFASPVTAKADSKQLIRLTVFILDGQGLGVSNQTVSLSLPSPLSQKIIQSPTDQYGKAIFDISSSAIGKFQVSASINSDKIPQSLNLVFY